MNNVFVNMAAEINTWSILNSVSHSIVLNGNSKRVAASIANFAIFYYRNLYFVFKKKLY
jgi:hypothetical protein